MAQLTTGERSAATPGAAELVVAFINTQPSGGGQPELIGDGGALSRWLDDHGLTVDPQDVGDGDAETARELREALSTLLWAHVGDHRPADVERAESSLRDAAERFPVLLRIHENGSQLLPARRGVHGAFASILAAVAETTATNQWLRIKMCKNPPCHTGFRDKTRNGSGAYCSAQCGSQFAMRAYRARLKTED
jgi:predicted RNA-binding Zn ribbon-like protein